MFNRSKLLRVVLHIALLGTVLTVGSPSVSAAPYDTGTKTGDVACSSGYFSVANGVIMGNSNCAGAANIPAGVTSIGNAAFENAFSLTSVSIPSSVSSIGNGAFANATGLLSIVIPDSVTSIGEYAFLSASNLISVTISSGVSVIRSSTFRDASSLTSVTIPNSVTSIENDAFYGTSSLAQITIPNQVTTIGRSAFSQSGLTSIRIPDGVTSISDELFRGSASLVSISLPRNLSTIGGYAFTGTGLTSVTIPNGVTTIGDYAFQGASSLTSIEIPNAVTSLGEGVFMWNTNLTSIKLPESLVRLNSYLFYGASSLRYFKFPRALTSIGKQTFSRTGLTSIVIPENVREIDAYAFMEMANLETVIIQNGVLTISNGAFIRNPSLRTVVIPDSVINIGGDVAIDDGDDPVPGIIDFNGVTVCVSYNDLVVRNISPQALGGLVQCTQSRRVSIASGSREAITPATPDLPAIKISFGGMAPTALTVLPMTSNPAPVSATPFTLSGTTKIVEIQVSGSIIGPFTVCLDGFQTDRLYHFTDGAWVELPSRTYVNGQVCGVTSSFSPFVAAPPAPSESLVAGRVSTFSSNSSYDSSFTVQVTNFDEAFTYSLTSSAGRATIDSKGLITVTGIGVDQSASVTVTTTRAGYESASAAITGRSQVAAMVPTNTPVVTITATSIMCTMGSYSAAPTSAAFSLFVDGKHVSTIFSALGEYLPDWIIPWATSSTITRTASLTSATWAISDAYKGKAVTCTTLAYSKNAIGFTASQVMVAR